MKTKLKPVLDSQLSWLDWTPQDSMNLLQRMRGGTPIKRRLSLALVLAIVLSLLALGALALTLWKNYYDSIAHQEGNYGYFDTWTGQQRANFILDMQKEGIQFDQSQVSKLTDRATPDAEKARIATELILSKYEGMREDTITAISILEAEKGPLPAWPLADKARYTQMLIETGRLGYDEEMYWLPGKEDISQVQAEGIARQAILDAFRPSLELLDTLIIHAELRSMAFEKEARYWHVFFAKPGVSIYEAPAPFSVWMDSRTGEISDLRDYNGPRERLEREKQEEQSRIEDLALSFRRAVAGALPLDNQALRALQTDWADQLPLIDQSRSLGGLHSAYRHLMDLQLLVEDDISPQDQAETLQTAQQHILALPSWTLDKLALYELIAQLRYHSSQSGQDVEQLLFTLIKDDAPEGQTQQGIQQRLLTQFGGRLQEPLYISLRLDAQSGELLEPPLLALPSQIHTPGGPPPFGLLLFQ